MKDEKIFQGLTSTEAAELLQKYGYNTISKEDKFRVLKIFLGNFNSPIVLILFISSAFAYFFGEVRDSIIILFMVLLSACLDFFQEYRTGNVIAKLTNSLHRKTTVIRDGKKQEIALNLLVPGDLIFATIGDILPGDGIVQKTDNFQVNESTLTGESFPVDKPLNEEVYSGTTVVSGFAYVIIQKTGVETKFGKLADGLKKATPLTAYQKGINDFSLLILKAGTVIVFTVLAINIIKGTSLFESVLFSIAIAVGLVPELLPVIASINMARGSLLMSKKGVLVKKMDAIPDFGSMNILCTDKTGTLTENSITLVKHLNLQNEEDEHVYLLSYINSYFQTGLKNPLDDAILNHELESVDQYQKVSEIPYTFESKTLGVVVKTADNRHLLITKGQPDEMLKLCTVSEDTKKKFYTFYDELSKDGFRVLAVCHRDFDVNEKIEQSEMVLDGLLAFLDPAKKSAGKALQEINQKGVQVKIITGDNRLVTEKICREIGLEINGLIDSDEFITLDEKGKLEAAKKCNIFARFNPAQKQEIIKLLRSDGNIVGYMGDGINDALSLKSADVGISVDNAVDVARESADIILLDKDLNYLLNGITEGRKTFANTNKYTLMAISSNFGNMLSMIGAVLFLPFLPMLPVQILLNNTLYDISQLALPFDTVDKEYIEKPRRWDMKFLKTAMIVFGMVSSAFDLISFFVFYKIFNLSESQFQTAWFIESIATQLLVIYIIRSQKSFFTQSMPSKLLILNSAIILLIAVILPFTAIGLYFGFSQLPTAVFISIFAIVTSYLIVAGIAKRRVWIAK